MGYLSSHILGLGLSYGLYGGFLAIYFTHLNSSARTGDDSPFTNHDSSEVRVRQQVFFTQIYPLVNIYIANWKDPPLFMGKSTISMAMASIVNC